MWPGGCFCPQGTGADGQRHHRPGGLYECDCDTVFDGTLRQGLSVQLEQSPFLSIISDSKSSRRSV